MTRKFDWVFVDLNELVVLNKQGMLSHTGIALSRVVTRQIRASSTSVPGCYNEAIPLGAPRSLKMPSMYS